MANFGNEQSEGTHWRKIVLNDEEFRAEKAALSPT